MRIALLSDLHLSVGMMPFPETDADVLVLAGDLSRPDRAMEWARQSKIPTVYVAGNHDFYGSDLLTTYADLNRLAAGSNIHVLERGEWHYQDVRFLGCTLWSDFRFFGSAEQRATGLTDAVKLIHDFSRIKVAPDFDQPFTPALSQHLFMQSVAWLEDCFARPHAGPTVVVTHYAPTPASVSPRFPNSPLNACFVSDITDHLRRWQPDLWLHGHLHDSFDYRVGRTRVVCNPRGYAKKGVNENPAFDPALVIAL